MRKARVKLSMSDVASIGETWIFLFFFHLGSSVLEYGFSLWLNFFFFVHVLSEA
jgi:hypothetical protein